MTMTNNETANPRTKTPQNPNPHTRRSHHTHHQSRKPRRRPRKNDTNTDRISDLPDHLAHRVMSFLGSTDTAAALSRHWRRLAASFPELDFRQKSHVFDHWLPHTSPTYQAQCRRFAASVDAALASYLSSNPGAALARFRLDTRLDGPPDMPSLLDKCVAAIMQVGVGEISLSIDVDREMRTFYVLPESTFVRAPPICGVYSKFHPLRKLSLGHVVVTEKMIGEMVRTCPEISEISLFQCRGFKSFVIDHRWIDSKLEIVEVVMPPRGDGCELERVEIDAKNLRVFSVQPSELSLRCEVGLASCRNLREIALQNCSLSDEWFRSQIPRFSLLEDLKISRCHNVRDVRLSARRLRRLCIDDCENMKRIEIDAPNLSAFRLLACEIPVLLAKNDEQCVLDFSFLYRDSTVDSSWFLKLREFLAASKLRKILDLSFYCNEVTFDLQELREAIIPQPHEVEDLVLSGGMKKISEDCVLEALLDGLLWGCRPKRISFERYCIPERLFEVLGKKLLNRESSLNRCCKCYCHIKCWRHDLKSAKIAIVNDGEEHVTDISLNFFSKIVRLKTMGSEVSYIIEWSS